LKKVGASRRGEPTDLIKLYDNEFVGQTIGRKIRRLLLTMQWPPAGAGEVGDV
jgi:hypothetical protein